MQRFREASMPRRQHCATKGDSGRDSGAAHGGGERVKIVNRRHRIEGQVAGVARMIEDNRYCIDILTQAQAVKSALSKVEDAILSDHASHCVAAAINAETPTISARSFRNWWS